MQLIQTYRFWRSAAQFSAWRHCCGIGDLCLLSTQCQYHDGRPSLPDCRRTRVTHR